MSNESTNDDAKPSQPTNLIPEGERIPTADPQLEQLSVPKTIVLPSAQVPAQPPQATAPPKPAPSGSKEE